MEIQSLTVFKLVEIINYLILIVATGEVTFKVAPNYEAPQSISAVQSVGSTESDFSSVRCKYT